MGGLGSGAWEKHNRQIVGSCCEIDANHLSAGGCLEPGQSSTIPLGICNSPDDGIDRGGGGGVVVLNCAPKRGGCSCLGAVFSTTPMLAPFMHVLVGTVTLRKTADFLTRIR